MSELKPDNRPQQAPEVRFFAAVSPDQDAAYPIMTPGALAVLDPDCDESADATILAGLVHP